jgi:hypothetical protein
MADPLQNEIVIHEHSEYIPNTEEVQGNEMQFQKKMVCMTI